MFIQLLVAFLVSMIPMIELRGAIPIAKFITNLTHDLPAADWAILLTAIVGNILPVPIIFLFSKKVLDWGAKCKYKHFKKFCLFCLKKGTKLGQKLEAKVHGGIYWALFLFVAIPIPGTGAWTGTLAATILNLDFKKTMFAVISGVIVAGIIMIAASLGLFNLIFH